MDKLKMETPDITVQNIEKIGELFPEAITEARGADERIKKAINFETLRQLLSSDVLEGDEAYEFTWVGKKASMVEATRPIRKTLRPCVDESVNWDSTENLYIEGDNLDVLKLLQESYLGKVKMIYIDPPYNTGHDFIYNDRFEMNQEDYDEQIGLFDDEENKNFKENADSNPRFHSDWCSMMYPRLKLASMMLSDDGVIFISIDDNEQTNIKEICNQIFGTSNFVANIIWKRKRGRDNSAKWFSKSHEYLIVYAKNKNCFTTNYLPLDLETQKAYRNPDNDYRGPYRVLGCWARGTQGGVRYDYKSQSGQYFSERLWLLSRDNLKKLDIENKLIIHGDKVYRKMFINENKGKIPETLWDNVSNAANASDEIKKIFSKIIFDTPKPIPYIIEMLRIASEPDSLVFDFFSGSATTAHAVMQLNAEDGGHRKFIMVQLPEACDEQSEAYKAGYKNICEIGKERIRRAGNKIKTEIEEANAQVTADGETKTVPDIGFRVLKLGDTNMKDVYYSAQDYDQQMLAGLEDNIKEDRTDRDLLFGCLLSWGLPLNLPYTTETLDGCTVHTYNDGDLIACFDKKVPEGVVRAIAGRKPLRAVFRDAGFASSPEKINVEEIFKLLAPNTRVKVI